jgi:hypothetical protein
MGSNSLISMVDHLVYATPDLDAGVAHIESLVRVRPIAGGSHPGWGTRNALLGLGPGCYLEVIGPDPDQAPPAGGRAFGVDGSHGGRLVTWAAKADRLDALHATAAEHGVRLGAVRSGSRQRPDGTVVTWRLTDPREVLADGIVPFFIDWGASLHPSESTPVGGRLVSLRAEHPDAAEVSRMLRRLGIDLAITPGAVPRLVAVVEGDYGTCELT